MEKTYVYIVVQTDYDHNESIQGVFLDLALAGKCITDRATGEFDNTGSEKGYFESDLYSIRRQELADADSLKLDQMPAKIVIRTDEVVRHIVSALHTCGKKYDSDLTTRFSNLLMQFIGGAGPENPIDRTDYLRRITSDYMDTIEVVRQPRNPANAGKIIK